MTLRQGKMLLDEIEGLALEVTEHQYKIQPDLMQRYGKPGFEKSRRDTVYTLHYLAESVRMDSPSLFVHYVGWLKQLLAGYGLTEADIRTKLELILDRVRASEKDEWTDRTIRILNRGIARTVEAGEVPSFLNKEHSLGAESRMYLDALLSGDRVGANTLIDQLIERGETIRDIYRYIFQASQYEVGRLWQTQQISVADEHYCTAATQGTMSRLYARWLGTERQSRKGTLVSACVGGEKHEIGLRMLTDVFEMEGWDTHYLGTSIDEDKLMDLIAQRKADIVALSATMTFHVRLMKKLIANLRADERTADALIMVGGLPFNVDPLLWQRVGADGYAPDAEGALAEAERLTANRRPRERVRGQTVTAAEEEGGQGLGS